MMMPPRKRFGQHFLRDKSVVARMVSALALTASDVCVEIGPGRGVLTDALAHRVKQLIAIELDRDLVPYLQQRFIGVDTFNVVQADVLDVDFSTLVNENPLRVVGNLPYNISTPLLFHCLQYRTSIRDMVFMLQKEVVQRLAAAPGSKTYGRLSVMIQYYCQVTSLFEVGPQAFSPPPKVDSAVVQLVPYQTSPYAPVDHPHFATVVRAAFSHRRKTLANCLRDVMPREHIRLAGIDPAVRAEMLSVEDFVRLARVATA